ncbi:MFS transporter [Devosia sp. 919]|uniref:MFS transporter n=1 Tax=Devosia sp. 919 TaxID=2726065 RepID=UPI001AEF0A4E|nr:MFS transporter [Devosia sp. 919]
MSDIAMPSGAGTQTRVAREKLAPEALIAIAVLIASTFTVILNEMMMAVALPQVMVDLGITASTGQWLTTGYMLTMAVVIPATGFLTERFRMRTVYTIALSLFTVGTLIAIVAPGFSVLLIGRIVQAVGTAIATPLAFTAVTALVPQSRRGQMMALLTVATSTAPAFGPAIAGSILSGAGWRMLFITILPVAVICLIVGNRMIKVPSTPRHSKIDGLSVLLSAVGFSGLVYGLASLGEGSAEHVIVSPWLAMGVGLVFVPLFAGRQLQLQKSDRALLDMRPFANRTFATTAIIAMGFMTAAGGMMTLMPVMLQTSYGLTPLQTGLFMLPGGLTIDRLYRCGRVVFSVHPCSRHTHPAAARNASLGALNKHLLPHGSAIMNTIQQLTGAARIAIAFSIMTSASAAYVAGGEALAPSMAHGAQQYYLVACFMVIGILFIALLMPKTKAGEGNSVPVAIH